MNDELPTEERLRRIERGVQRRIGLRRTVAQRVAVGAAAVLLLVGGVAVLRPVLSTSSSSSGAAGSSARDPGFSSAASPLGVAVECHGARTATATADPAGLPASAVAACATAERGASPSSLSSGDASGSGATAGGATPTSTPPPVTLCRTKEGALHVYPGLPAVCAGHGMTPYPG